MVKVAVSGLGNLGKFAIEAIECAPDMTCTGVIRRKETVGTKSADLRGVADFESFDALREKAGVPDVVILCGPSRQAARSAEEYLNKGSHTVDSFDIHHEIMPTVKHLNSVATKAGKAAITAAGWDPGTDSVWRVYLEAMAPAGTTFTNFGRGRSMGHSVAARAVKGVEDAVSITIPIGGGRHSRLVYVVVSEGQTLASVTEHLKADDYFAHDPLQVVQVSDAKALELVADASHGVLLERIGGYGSVSNQRFMFDMRINNPALTAQILVCCARAAVKMPSGAHTLIDVPPVYLLPGERMKLIERLV